MHVMSRETFERQAAREVSSAQVADGLLPVYTEEVAGRAVTFNTIQLSESPDFKGEAAKRRHLTLAGMAKQKAGAR